MARHPPTETRIRDALTGLDGIAELPMMGGLCFLLDGNMLCGVREDKTGDISILLRVGKDQQAVALARPGAEKAVMGSRVMGGFIRLPVDACEDDAVLGDWLSMALQFVTSLPPK